MAQLLSVGLVPKRKPCLSNLRRDLLEYLTGEDALKDRDHDWVLEKSVLDHRDILLKTHVGRGEDHFFSGVIYNEPCDKAILLMNN